MYPSEAVHATVQVLLCIMYVRCVGRPSACSGALVADPRHLWGPQSPRVAGDIFGYCFTLCGWDCYCHQLWQCGGVSGVSTWNIH